LLAKNGTIGAPPVGGRRRRRRGNADAVTVAELTGEIPIVTDTGPHAAVAPDSDEPDEDRAPSANGVAEPHVDDDGAQAERNDLEESAEETAEGRDDAVDGAEPAAELDEFADDHTDDHADEEADYEAHLREREAQPLFAEPSRRRPHYAHAQRRYTGVSGGVDAEQMSPDPVDLDDDEADEAVNDLTRPALAVTAAPGADEDADELPSYLRSSAGTLFGGDSVADDIARRGGARYDELDAVEDVAALRGTDLDEYEDRDVDEDVGHESTMSAFARGALVVGQCIVAVLFGAGLFIGFDQLWKWNNIVALVLSVLVILGLVVGVRVVRKTEDIGSTLIAVAVGALVTLGPLALLQSG